MRHFLILAMAWTLVGSTSAAPSDDLAHNAGVARAAADLFRKQRAGDAVAYISANVRSVDPAKSSPLARAEMLIWVAFILKGSRDGALAVSAANEALALLDLLPGSQARDSARSDVLYAAGVACERVLHDAARAEQFHRAAVAFNPANRIASEALVVLMRRKGPGRP